MKPKCEGNVNTKKRMCIKNLNKKLDVFNTL